VSEDELFEYPASHVGTRQYVSVRGYSRSIPKYKTFRDVQGYNAVLPEYGGLDAPCTSGSPFYMQDKADYVSPVDGKVISGRAAHRQHCSANSMVECGDRPVAQSRTDSWKPATGYDIVNAIRQLGGS
jgi:hypothetical protein